MDELLRAWETTFGRSTLPFGVAEVLLDDQGRPYDFAYRYINAAAAALTGHVTEDLLGEEGEGFSYLGANLPQERLGIALGAYLIYRYWEPI